MKKFLCLILSVLLLAGGCMVFASAIESENEPVSGSISNAELQTAAANFTTASPYTSSTYTHYGTFAGKTIENCIDVSEHNGLINWYKIKAMGVSSAIIRVGYRGYGSAGTLAEDDYFYDNMDGALAAGLKVGIYFYSQALNTTEATAEAKFALARLKNYKFTLPVYYDYEFADPSGRLDKAWASGTLTRTKMTDNALAFCKTIKAAGYKSGVYASADFLGSQLNSTTIVNNGNTIWLAYYTTNSTRGNYWHNTNNNYEMWQYSSEGKVAGTCGQPGSTWINVQYGTKKGYVLAFYLNFTGASSAVSTTSGLNLRSGKGTNYDSIAKIPENGKLTVLGYPTTTVCDVNFMYKTPGISAPSFTLSPNYRKISISWAKVSGAAFYRVYEYDTTAKTYTRLTQTTSLSYTDDNLKDYSQHTYLVRAFTSAEVGSNYTSASRKSAYTAPAKPVLNTSGATSSSVSLVWGKVSGASYYRVYKYLSGNEYERITQTTSTSAVVKNLSAGKAYQFLVRAFGSNGVGNGYTLNDNLTLYTTPKKLAFNISAGSNTVTLSWAKTAGASMYRVYSYNTSKKTYTRLTQTESTSYTVSGLKNNTKYTYLVRAFTKTGYAENYSLADNKSIYTAPAKPEFKLTKATSSSLSVSWNKVSGASYYRVYKYLSGTQFKRLAQTTSTSITLKDLAAGTSYGILVRAFNSNGSGSSYAVGGDMLSFKTLPAKPTFSLKASNNSITISWNNVLSMAYYRVYSYDTTTKKYTRIAQTSALKYTVSGLKNNTKYTYLVRAFNSAGAGSTYNLSDNKSATTTLAKPVFSVTSPSDGQVKISWDKLSGASYYRVYRHISGNEYKRIAEIKSADALTFTDKNLESGRSYQYLVRAFTSSGVGSAYTLADNKKVTVK